MHVVQIVRFYFTFRTEDDLVIAIITLDNLRLVIKLRQLISLRDDVLITGHFLLKYNYHFLPVVELLSGSVSRCV